MWILADPPGYKKPTADNIHNPNWEVLLPMTAAQNHVSPRNHPKTDVKTVKGPRGS